MITKADRVEPGDTGKQKMWKNVFEGHKKEHQLHLGYYAVCLPTDEQRARNISREEVQQAEMRDFDTRVPWKDLKAIRPCRLGVAALVRDISTLLLQKLYEACVLSSLLVPPMHLVSCLNSEFLG